MHTSTILFTLVATLSVAIVPTAAQDGGIPNLPDCANGPVGTGLAHCTPPYSELKCICSGAGQAYLNNGVWSACGNQTPGKEPHNYRLESMCEGIYEAALAAIAAYCAANP